MPEHKELELLLELADKSKVNKKTHHPTENQSNNPTSSTSDSPDSPDLNISSLLDSPFFREYGLDDKDVKIIALLLKNLLDGKDCIKTADVLKSIENNNTHAAFLSFTRIIHLKEKGIVEPRGYCEDNAELLRSDIRLSDKFVSRLYQFNESSSSPSTITPYRDNLEYLADQFERIKVLREISRYLEKDYSEDDITEKNNKLKAVENRIEERLKNTRDIFPFEAFKHKKPLTREEELVILALLEKDTIHAEHSDEVESLVNLISRTFYEKLTNKRLFNKNSRLLRDKVVEIHRKRGLFIELHSVKLNERLRDRFLNERDNRTDLKENGFFEVITPSIPFDRVILHPETSEKLATAVGMVQGNGAYLLYKWGLRGNNPSSSRKRNHQSLTLLFYGPPGTGKTLSASAIACSLKRKLLTLDCSKILSVWVGESEKNTRKIFDRYRELSRSLKRHPVLLLNEADQFLHRRINAGRSVDHMYNQMQNIFLEQLESFEGVLIATTNLIENLDPAFSRRFHFKIEFKRPGKEERLKLWRVLIPEKVPLSDDIDFLHLATHYDLSGGQISTIIRNAATRAAMRGDSINQNDLIKACEDEIHGNFDDKAKGIIGFKERTPYKNHV